MLDISYMLNLRERVQARLEELERNPFDAARKGGLNKHFIDDLLIGKKDTVKQTSLPKLAKALDWTVSQLLEGCEYSEPEAAFSYEADTQLTRGQSNSVSITRLSGAIPEFDLRAGASYGGGYALQGNLEDDGGIAVRAEWKLPDSWLKGEMRLSAAFTDIIAIDGPSMIPDLAPGDRVLVDRSNRDPKQDAIFAIRDGESIIVKHVQLIRNSDPPRIICRSSNPKYEPFELILDDIQTEIIGRVAGRISRL
jgi:hypothetical protein